MKYILDLLLVAALIGVGWMWNSEKKNGLDLSDELDNFKSRAAQLEQRLQAAEKTGTETAEALTAAQEQAKTQLEEIKAKSDELLAKDTELTQLKETGAKLLARVRELEGYKQKAIVAEMPSAVTAP